MINIGTIRNLDRVKKYARDTVITGADAGNVMFVILKGEAGVYTNGMQTDAELLMTLGAGDLFADCGLLHGIEASYTAVLLRDSIILPVEREAVQEFFQEEPALTFEIFKELCFRLEQTSAAYKALIVQHAAAHRSAAGPGGNPAKR